MSRFTHAEKAAEAEREVKMRLEVYGRNAKGGSLSPSQQRRIDMMREIADEYADLAKKNQLL
jgi:hypothetical protein